MLPTCYVFDDYFLWCKFKLTCVYISYIKPTNDYILKAGTLHSSEKDPNLFHHFPPIWTIQECE